MMCHSVETADHFYVAQPNLDELLTGHDHLQRALDGSKGVPRKSGQPSSLEPATSSNITIHRKPPSSFPRSPSTVEDEELSVCSGVESLLERGDEGNMPFCSKRQVDYVSK